MIFAVFVIFTEVPVKIIISIILNSCILNQVLDINSALTRANIKGFKLNIYYINFLFSVIYLI